MSPLAVVITVAAYLLILSIVAYISSRHSDNGTFFNGNRQSSWYLVAFAMISASMSGVTYVSVPGMVGISGWGYFQMYFGFLLGQIIIAYVWTPLFYRINLTSIYQYLEDRFGSGATYKTGAWLFFISKITGAAVRLLLLCLTLQLLVGDPWGIPFWLNVLINLLIVWLYTKQGGVKSLVWTDSLKTICLVGSVILCTYFIAQSMDLSFAEWMQTFKESPRSRMFYFDDINHKQYFWKQCLAGMFTMMAMTGLDQDMMQRNLSCRNLKEAQKNMMTSILMQGLVIMLFLVLGVMLYTFADAHHLDYQVGDQIFPLIATGGHMPTIVGILFIIGLAASSYSSGGSALTALTTSFTIDIIGTRGKSTSQIAHIRKLVHLSMAILLGLLVFIIGQWNNSSIIDAVYVLASYTYGPILGLFCFALIAKQQVNDRYTPLVCLAAPALCFWIQSNAETWLNGYQLGYELLLLNAAFTIIGLFLIRKKKSDILKR